MTIITLPLTLPIKDQVFGTRDFNQTFANGDTGASQVKVGAPPRYTCSLVSEERIPDARMYAMWRALVHDLNGQVNQLAVFDLLHPVPRGSARGGWMAAATAPAGATTITIDMGAAQAGKTLLQGDWFGVNQAGKNRELLHVQADAVANAAGVIAVRFAPALRASVAAMSTMAWERPTCLMRRTTAQSSWTSQANTQGGFSLDLMESWE
ncbi:hypothetical protein [Variovorax sp.]|uniref:hypothetical protein n=1 Tax=Variovorax sp. TaxID=1871043 RepID=UPI003BABF07A